MGLRDKKLVANEYYHIYNRGNWKNDIFLDEDDYDHFEKLLYLCNSENKFTFRDDITENKIDAYNLERGTPIVSILAWVLMPNHFHIIIISHRSDLWEKGYNPITEFMRRLSTSYVMYLNKKYDRTGGLFEGVFKSRHIGDDNYFNYLFAYVHLNPVKLIQLDWKTQGIADKNKTIDFLNKYKHSSFQNYLGTDKHLEKIFDRKSVPVHLLKIHVSDLFKWITFP